MPNRAADIFEINIDPVRTGSSELFGEIGRAMIDSDVEAKFFHNGAAFFGAASDDHCSRASHRSELSNERTHRSACGCDYNGLARLRLTDQVETRVGGEARHAEHAEPRSNRSHGRVQLAQD